MKWVNYVFMTSARITVVNLTLCDFDLYDVNVFLLRELILKRVN